VCIGSRCRGRAPARADRLSTSVHNTSSPVAALPGPVSSPTITPLAPPPSELPRPPSALQEALEGAAKAVAAGDATTADKQIAAAVAAAGDDAHFAYLVARVRALRYAYVGDFESAAAAFLAVLPTLAKHPELPDEFWSHNAMMMIREAQGDPARHWPRMTGDPLRRARHVGSARPATLAFQKDRWHRAYLTRMLAESRTGSVKQALVQYAQAALDEYRAPGFPDSVAVLDAYFAALDGSASRAGAASRVDPAKDDDIEDLYLVSWAWRLARPRGCRDCSAGDAPARERAYRARDHAPLARFRREGTADPRFYPWHAGPR